MNACSLSAPDRRYYSRAGCCAPAALDPAIDWDVGTANVHDRVGGVREVQRAATGGAGSALHPRPQPRRRVAAERVAGPGAGAVAGGGRGGGAGRGAARCGDRGGRQGVGAVGRGGGGGAAGPAAGGGVPVGPPAGGRHGRGHRPGRSGRRGGGGPGLPPARARRFLSGTGRRLHVRLHTTVTHTRQSALNAWNSCGFLSSPMFKYLSVSSFGICQGMSWQHLNQPCVAG